MNIGRPKGTRINLIAVTILIESYLLFLHEWEIEKYRSTRYLIHLFNSLYLCLQAVTLTVETQRPCHSLLSITLLFRFKETASLYLSHPSIRLVSLSSTIYHRKHNVFPSSSFRTSSSSRLLQSNHQTAAQPQSASLISPQKPT